MDVRARYAVPLRYNTHMELIDIGANLGHESFDQDLPEVLARARAAGVVQMVITGASREGSPRALQIAQQNPHFLYATAGVHPHHAVEYTQECDREMRALHQHTEVIAVGECGLDYFRDLAPRPAQRKAFEQQLQLAADLQKPLFLHQRDAHDDFLAMMKNFDGQLRKAVVHCFTGTKKELYACLDANFYIGNHAVLVPVYSHRNDKKALQIIRKQFPRRKIVAIECTPLVYGLGSIHCVTQQQPA